MPSTKPDTPPLQSVPRRRPIERSIGWERFWIQYGGIIGTIINFSLFFFAWELLARADVVSKLILPRFSEVINITIELAQKGELSKHLIFSAGNFTAGFLIASVTGIPLGLALGASKTLDRILGPYVWALFSTPRLAILPLITIVMGFGSESKIFLVFIGAFFVIVINTWAGVQTVDQSLIRAGRAFGANRIQLFTKIVVPYTLPFIIVGLRLGVTRALVVNLVSEMLASSRGMGYLVIRAVDSFKTEQLFSMILILVIVSMSLVTALRHIELWIAPWRKDNSI